MRSTHTSKRYAIDLINEFKAKALEKVGVSSEPCLVTHKQDAVRDGSAVYLPMNKVKKACRLKMKQANRGSYHTNHIYNTSIDIESLVEMPVSYKEALREHKKATPKRRKLVEQVNAAHDEAERAIMLGGTDTQIAKAVSKLERLLK